MTPPSSQLACNMNALAPEDRAQHASVTRELFQVVQRVQELENGYAFCFPNNTTIIGKIAIFIASERLCCPFFGFSMEIEPDGGPLWLKLTGGEGIKPFIRAELGETFSSAIAQHGDLG